MPDGKSRQEEYWASLTEALWRWIDKTYSAEEAQYLREHQDEPDVVRAFTDYFAEVISPTLEYPEITGEALRRKRAYETERRFATYTGRMPKQWMVPLMASFPEGFGGYEAGTAGFFKALDPEKWAEYQAELASLRKEKEEAERQRQYAALPLAARLTPEQYQRYTRQRAWETQRVEPEYSKAFAEAEAGLAGPEPWKDWFSSRYRSIAAEFETTIPKFEERYWPGLTPKEVERSVEESWAEYLKSPRFREEYAIRHPFGMGGRPWAYQPRVQTVRFGR